MNIKDKFYDFLAFYIVIFIGVFGLGWILNLQNLFQYPIESNKFLISVAGVFIPFIGMVTGWIW